MPKYDPSTPTTVRKFLGGREFLVPLVFAEGHVMTANETKWANAQVGTVIGNAYSGDVRRAVNAITAERIKAAITAPAKQKAALEAFDKKGTVPEGVTAATDTDLNWDHDAKFAEKFAAYELGAGRSGSGPKSGGTDPVESLVRAMATNSIKALILKAGRKVKDFMDAKSSDGSTSRYMELINEYIANHPELADTARAQLASAGEDVDLDLGAATPKAA